MHEAGKAPEVCGAGKPEMSDVINTMKEIKQGNGVMGVGSVISYWFVTFGLRLE